MKQLDSEDQSNTVPKKTKRSVKAGRFFFHGDPKFQAISSTSHENGRQCNFHADMIKVFITKINNQ